MSPQDDRYQVAQGRFAIRRCKTFCLNPGIWMHCSLSSEPCTLLGRIQEVHGLEQVQRA